METLTSPNSALSVAPFAATAEFLPPNGRRGGQWKGHRSAIDGILWVLADGGRWPDLPDRFGPRQTVHGRFRNCDKGYSAEWIRAYLLAEGVEPVIPHQTSEPGRGRPFDRAAYRERNRIERGLHLLRGYVLAAESDPAAHRGRRRPGAWRPNSAPATGPGSAAGPGRRGRGRPPGRGRPDRGGVLRRRPPAAAPDLVRVAGSRRGIGACVEAAEGDGGLDEYAVRGWVGWHRPVARPLFAPAVVAAIRSPVVAGGRKKVGRADPAAGPGSPRAAAGGGVGRHPAGGAGAGAVSPAASAPVPSRGGPRPDAAGQPARRLTTAGVLIIFL